jgi:hypothetical protein
MGKLISPSIKRALTSLATFYIPLSFASSLLGMNVSEISASSTPLWLFFAIAIPMSIVSLVLVANWGHVSTGWDYLFSSRFRKDDENRRTRWANAFSALWEKSHMKRWRKNVGSDNGSSA